MGQLWMGLRGAREKVVAMLALWAGVGLSVGGVAALCTGCLSEMTGATEIKVRGKQPMHTRQGLCSLAVALGEHTQLEMVPASRLWRTSGTL